MAKGEVVTEYGAVCQWRYKGRDEAHLSPLYRNVLEARGWVAQHRFGEDHAGCDRWVIDLLVYPAGGTPDVLDRWQPIGVTDGAPDPGHWLSGTPAADPGTPAGRESGRRLVAFLRDAFAQLENTSGPTSALLRAPITPLEYAEAKRQGWDEYGDPGPPVGTHVSPPPVRPEDLASCGHIATRYDEKGRGLCERDDCQPTTTKGEEPRGYHEGGEDRAPVGGPDPVQGTEEGSGSAPG